MGSSTRIRRGRHGEAEELAKLHVAVWRATYGAYAPKEAIAALDEAKRLPYWSSALTYKGPGLGVWVADQNNSIVGVVSIGESENDLFGGRIEIKHLYVAENAQGQGLGGRLLQTALNEGGGADCPGVALAVVQQNISARRFYKRMGGAEIGAFPDPGPLWRSDNILVAWDDV